MSLTKEVSDLIMDAELASVFGFKNIEKKILYSEAGVSKEVSMG
jgi:hypothetical protein